MILFKMQSRVFCAKLVTVKMEFGFSYKYKTNAIFKKYWCLNLMQLFKLTKYFEIGISMINSNFAQKWLKVDPNLTFMHPSEHFSFGLLRPTILFAGLFMTLIQMFSDSLWLFKFATYNWVLSNRMSWFQRKILKKKLSLKGKKIDDLKIKHFLVINRNWTHRQVCLIFFAIFIGQSLATQNFKDEISWVHESWLLTDNISLFKDWSYFCLEKKKSKIDCKLFWQVYKL